MKVEYLSDLRLWLQCKKELKHLEEKNNNNWKKKVFINKIGIKERKIADVLEKVGLWRKLYDGFHDENGR